MKWLLRTITGKQILLSPLQLAAVVKRVAEYAAKERWATFWNFAPGALPLLAIPLWPHLRKSLPMHWYVVCEVIFVIGVLGLMYWVFRRRYARYAWRAIRELGIADVCGACGYDFTGLPPDRTKCPECGSERGPFVAAGSIEKSQ